MKFEEGAMDKKYPLGPGPGKPDKFRAAVKRHSEKENQENLGRKAVIARLREQERLADTLASLLIAKYN